MALADGHSQIHPDFLASSRWMYQLDRASPINGSDQVVVWLSVRDLSMRASVEPLAS